MPRQIHAGMVGEDQGNRERQRLPPAVPPRVGDAGCGTGENAPAAERYGTGQQPTRQGDGR
ncbi:hypothetical protein GCM10010507_19260 [Streptomyces cinnamoneus]|uniref:Uncharacterized protein n=2 Tax=Streptomyces cinnamoneus TaxID=53446 RepID=A0A918TFF3_STRCJ|nr:hypothetical protein GCM10010507_19260 [Streptomyces cinnamoneus]